MQGFDAKGSEAYWTVTGDEVTTMAFANFTNSPGKELLVGSKDNEIRIPVPEAGTIGATIQELRVPEGRCHLVLLNGIFVPPSQRASATLSDGDTVAIWPPVAGG